MKKKWRVLALVLLVCLCGCEPSWGEPEQDTDICLPEETEDYAPAEKPMIYLYPEEETAVKVELQFDGEITCTYPDFEEGWIVTAAPDGTLTDENGREYRYLFWEGVPDEAFEITEGFVVPGNETLPFLENSLRTLGLSDREADDLLPTGCPGWRGIHGI